MGSYNRVISRISIFITYVGGLISPLIATHEPPSRVSSWVFGSLSSCSPGRLAELSMPRAFRLGDLRVKLKGLRFWV